MATAGAFRRAVLLVALLAAFIGVFVCLGRALVAFVLFATARVFLVIAAFARFLAEADRTRVERFTDRARFAGFGLVLLRRADRADRATVLAPADFGEAERLSLARRTRLDRPRAGVRFAFVFAIASSFPIRANLDSFR